MSQLEVDKIIPSSGTTLTIGDSGDSIDITSGATVTNFKSTGIDDNATSTEITIASDGDIGIGTTSPDGSDFGSGTGILHLKDIGSNNTGIKIEDGTTKYVAIVNGGGDAYTGTWSNNNLRFYTNSTERARFYNTGNFCIGTTNQSPAEDSTVTGIRLGNNGGTQISCAGAEVMRINRNTNDGRIIGLAGQSSVRGEIAVSGTTIQYTSFSDHRLKKDVQQISNATESVKQLNPVNFAWIESGVRMNGFLAHEVQSIVPEAVTGEKDAVETYTDDDGNEQTRPNYQGIDQSKLVPLLTASLKEALTEIDNLKARIEALENA